MEFDVKNSDKKTLFAQDFANLSYIRRVLIATNNIHMPAIILQFLRNPFCTLTMCTQLFMFAHTT